MLFKDFTQGFFGPDRCKLQDKLQPLGYNWPPSTLRSYRSILKNQLLPKFGNCNIFSIRQADLDDYILFLIDENRLSHSYINSIIHVMKLIFGFLKDTDFAEENIASQIEPIMVKHKEKGILTDEEVLSLFTTQGCWKDNRQKLFNLLACYTGLKLSELQALGYSQFIEHGGNYFIKVTRAWDQMGGLAEKNKTRHVPLPYWLVEQIRTINYLQDFWFSNEHNFPFTKNAVYNHYRKALNHIGITPEIRKERNISFNSWRVRYIIKLKNFVSVSEHSMLIGFRSRQHKYVNELFISSDTVEIINSDWLKEN